ESVDLTPDSGVSYLLTRAIGAGRARAMTTLGLRIDAETALEWGLVHEVVDADRVEAHVTALATRIAHRPQAHMSTSRDLYLGAGLDAALDAEQFSIAAIAASSTARAQVEAFVQR